MKISIRLTKERKKKKKKKAKFKKMIENFYKIENGLLFFKYFYATNKFKRLYIPFNMKFNQYFNSHIILINILKKLKKNRRF